MQGAINQAARYHHGDFLSNVFFIGELQPVCTGQSDLANWYEEKDG
jgi:hypothetical protein